MLRKLGFGYLSIPGSGSGATGTAGQVAFFTNTNVIGGDNDLFWDNTNKRLGIGTGGAPTSGTRLHVKRNATGGQEGAIWLDSPNATDQVNCEWRQAGNQRWVLYVPSGATPDFRIYNANLSADSLVIARTDHKATFTGNVVAPKLGATAAATFGSAQAILVMSSPSAGSQCNFEIQDNGTTKWILYKNSSNVLALYDNVAGADFLSFTTSGDIAHISTARHRMISQNRFRYLNALASVTKSANQTGLTQGTWTTLSFDQEDFDTDTIHDNVTNNSRLTANLAGKYLVTGNALVDDTNITTPTTVGLRILKNGVTTTVYGDAVAARAAAIPGGVLVSTAIITMSVNDYVELQAIAIGASGTFDVKNTNNITRFEMAYLGE